MDFTLFNEDTRSDHVLRNIKANVIDSCIEVIIGLPNITHTPITILFEHTRPHISRSSSASTPVCGGEPSDTIYYAVVRLRETMLPTPGCNSCASFIGRSYTLQQRQYPVIAEEELIKKKDLLDLLDDDDDIDWKSNPFDVDSIDKEGETPEHLISKITTASDQAQAWLSTSLTKVRRDSAAVEPMKIVIDNKCWVPCNRAPPRTHSQEKQKYVRKQMDALLTLGVIKESQATE